MFLFLWAGALYCVAAFIFARQPSRAVWRELWAWHAVTWQNMRPILLRFILAAVGMVIFTWLYDPDRLFGLLHTRPDIIPRIMVFYPVLSALPQEFIFCSFFFWRYADFFKTPRGRVLASAVVFAYGHVLFINPVAPPLSFIAGLIFAQTFNKTKSLALVTIEHGLYGNALFLVGLGWYFYGGALSP